MKKTRAFSFLGAAALLITAGSNAEAQLYEDLGGQPLRMTGIVSYQVSVSAAVVEAGVTLASFSTNLTGTVTLSVGSGAGFILSNNGVSTDQSLTGTVPLPAFDGIQLPSLSAKGSFNRNDVEYTSNSFQLTATGPTTSVPISVSASGINLTGSVTVSNPNVSFIGGPISPPSRKVDTIILSDTGTSNDPAVVNVGLSGCVNLSTFGCVNVSFPSHNIEFTSWTLTAIPGPSALAVFAPGFLGLSGMAMRRRKRRSAGVGGTGSPPGSA
jgi:hypothetical protein